MNLFVYGTLRPDAGGNHFDLIPLREAELPGWALYNLGSFPAAAPKRGSVVQGWIMKEPTEEQLEALDKYEGHPNFFKRTKVLVDGLECWMYYYPSQSGLGGKLMPRIESGDWLERVQEQVW